MNPVRAREIMGKNFFGTEEGIFHFGMTQSELTSLAEVPFPEEVLQQHKDSHFLVAVIPISILDIRSMHGRLFQLESKPEGKDDHQDWYNDQPFATETGEGGWQLVRKTPTENSSLKSWDEQMLVLAPGEEVPTTQTLVYTLIGYLKLTGERLLEKMHVRCSDISVGEDNGDRIVVGFDTDGRVYIGGYAMGDESRESTLGLAVGLQ